MAKLIPLTQGKWALVDDDDYERLSKWKWRAVWNRYTLSYYAVRSESRADARKAGRHRRQIAMSREICGLGFGRSPQVDHMNHDTLDNRKENLRCVTNRQNGENRRDQSQYGTGIQLLPSGRFWTHTSVAGITRTVGTFDTPEEARAAREAFVRELDGSR